MSAKTLDARASTNAWAKNVVASSSGLRGEIKERLVQLLIAAGGK